MAIRHTNQQRGDQGYKAGHPLALRWKTPFLPALLPNTGNSQVDSVWGQLTSLMGDTMTFCTSLWMSQYPQQRQSILVIVLLYIFLLVSLALPHPYSKTPI